MEITEAFHPQTPIGTPMGVNNVDPDPTGGRGLLHEGRGNPPKRSPNCNGHPASSSIQVYRDGEISFIPLQERGIILHGKPIGLLICALISENQGLFQTLEKFQVLHTCIFLRFMV